jgi:beta-phosphoglucomutase-like phosphatase (HAD superfamily)
LDKLATFRNLLRAARGLILDFDGLLADSERFHFAAYNEVFQRYGHTLDEKEYYKYWTSLGHGAQGEIERHGLGLDAVEIRREKMPIFSRYCEDGTITLFEDAKTMIDLLSRTGKRMAIASGTPAGDVRAVLRNAGVDGAFDAVLGSDTVKRIKPAPDVFLKALDALGLGASECLVFEDAEKGMFAAIEAAIPVVIVRTPQTEGFDFARADITFDSHAEIVGLLRRLDLRI